MYLQTHVLLKINSRGRGANCQQQLLPQAKLRNANVLQVLVRESM